MTNTAKLSSYEQRSEESSSSSEVRSGPIQYFIPPPVETGCEESQRIKIPSIEESSSVIPGDTIVMFESKYPGESSGKPLSED
jgi:hypothetical protein